MTPTRPTSWLPVQGAATPDWRCRLPGELAGNSVIRPPIRRPRHGTTSFAAAARKAARQRHGVARTQTQVAVHLHRVQQTSGITDRHTSDAGSGMTTRRPRRRYSPRLPADHGAFDTWRLRYRGRPWWRRSGERGSGWPWGGQPRRVVAASGVDGGQPAGQRPDGVRRQAVPRRQRPGVRRYVRRRCAVGDAVTGVL